jgi:leucyl/phenylalanyl-tRNA--protein transferase
VSLSLPWLDEENIAFPDPALALTTPNGLLAAGGDLRPERLIEAYRLGIFPWYSDEQPPLWWSPDPRMVLFPTEMHVSRSLRKVIRHGMFTITSDRAFGDVLSGCAAPRPGSDGTWLSTEMQEAYLQLHRLGHAHSIEVWRDGILVGGLYGIALDRIFYGESMFSRVSNASKAAMAFLAEALATAGYQVIDCQVTNPHLASLGARLISRASFFRYLPESANISRPAHWPIQ